MGSKEGLVRDEVLDVWGLPHAYDDCRGSLEATSIMLISQLLAECSVVVCLPHGTMVADLSSLLVGHGDADRSS